MDYTTLWSDVSHTVLGTFHPDSYCIGYVGDLEATLKDNIAYPVTEPETSSTRERFRNRLVLYHETMHFEQFLCTNFGLECARYLNIALGRLFRDGPWQLPVLRGVSEKQFSSYDGETLDRLGSYVFLRRQLASASVSVREDDGGIRLWSQPDCATNFLFGLHPTLENAQMMANGAGLPIHGVPILSVPISKTHNRHTVINVATLMEGFAHLTEMHHLLNAFPGMKSSDFWMNTLNFDPIYLTCFATYSALYDLEIERWPYHLAAIIDIALMYSPGIVHNVGPMNGLGKGQGEKFQLWGNTFLEACRAAQSVSPMQDFSRNEGQRFQNEVCQTMGIPTTLELTQMALKRLAAYGLTSERSAVEGIQGQTALINKIMGMHYIGLKYRADFGDGFATEMIKTEHIQEFIDLAQWFVTFYNIDTKQPHNFEPHRVFQSTAGQLVYDALVQEKLVCPLQQGQPYVCHNYGKNENRLCKWASVDGDDAYSSHKLGNTECFVDIFERNAMLTERRSRFSSVVSKYLGIPKSWK